MIDMQDEGSAFAIRITISTPLSLRGLLHLDGFLGSLAVMRGSSHDNIPLSRRRGITLGSVAILETGPFGAIDASQPRTKHLNDHYVPGDIFDGLKPSRLKIGSTSPYRNKLTSYPCLESVHAVWFTGTGDVEGVMELLHEARNIGAMGRTGYGRINSISSVPVKPHAEAGFAFNQSTPARVMPVEVWRDYSQDISSCVVSLERPIPPYWTGSRVLCIGPLQTDLILTRSEISELLQIG